MKLFIINKTIKLHLVVNSAVTIPAKNVISMSVTDMMLFCVMDVTNGFTQKVQV